MARRRGRRKSAKLSAGPVEVKIESLSHEGRGICHVDDKVVFVSGALAGEQLRFKYVSTHRNFDEGAVVEILTASPDRVTPECEFYDRCGGCSLQHMKSEKQIEMKQDVLLNLLSRTSQLQPEKIMAPLIAEYWGYRTKARLGVRDVKKKGRVLVGFREKHSPYLADMTQCEVLDKRVGHKLDVLSDTIGQLHASDKIAQIEVAITEQTVALIFRNLVELDEHDQDILMRLGETENFHIYLQPSGPDSIFLLYPRQSELYYTLSEYDLKLNFLPSDFTQVNMSINQQMIAQALELLALDKQDKVLDLFCGLGNFTLPIAKTAASVTGVEGDQGLIDRAHQNADNNNLTNIDFYVQDLTQDLADQVWAQQQYSKVLLDPARSGALEMMPVIAAMKPERIVYVSCNPATLARDAGELVQHGYKLVSTGVMDMFPHTAHVESMALFIRT